MRESCIRAMAIASSTFVCSSCLPTAAYLSLDKLRARPASPIRAQLRPDRHFVIAALSFKWHIYRILLAFSLPPPAHSPESESERQRSMHRHTLAVGDRRIVYWQCLRALDAHFLNQLQFQRQRQGPATVNS